MDATSVTRALGEALGVGVDAERLEALVAAYGDRHAEWSVNESGDGRGRLRVAFGTEDFAAAARAVARFLPEPWDRLDAHLPREGMAGLGLAFGAGPVRLRLYRAAPASGGARLAAAAIGRFPGLAPTVGTFAAACGGYANLTGLGLDFAGGALARVTVYFRLGDPACLRDLFAALALPDHPRSARFLGHVLGLAPARPRPWPKVWVGASLGTNGGVKLYAFLRGDPHRLPDGPLLDGIDAPPPLRRARDRFAEAVGADPVVQVLGHRLDAPEPPSLTVYLAPR